MEPTGRKTYKEESDMRKKEISIHEIRYNLISTENNLLKVEVTYFDGSTDTLYGESMKSISKTARENLRKRLTTTEV